MDKRKGIHVLLDKGLNVFPETTKCPGESDIPIKKVEFFLIRTNPIEDDPREFFFNIDACERQYYLKVPMQGDLLWRRVVDCFNPAIRINVFDIAKQWAANDDNLALQLAQRYHKNLERLRSIKNIDIAIQIVPSSASLEEAINNIDLSNSQGTKLTDAELALTHVIGKWAEARRVFKEKIAQLEQRKKYFDLSFLTRALTVIVTKRTLFEQIHARVKSELVDGWDRLDRRLDYLVTILPGNAHIHSTEDLTTTNVLIPLILYLDINKGSLGRNRACK